MSKIQIEISDDRWFRGEWQFRPQDKQLCVVIIDSIVRILQYRTNFFGTNGILHSLDMPTYYSWLRVDRWKPLGLPTDVEERILAKIEKWFENDK